MLSINWESAAHLTSNLLNEAVLDDGQALYRVRSSKKMLAKVTNVNISSAELKQKIALVGGNPEAKTIDEAFLHTVQQPKLAKRPSNVVLIVGESFGQWPFLLQFKDLGLVDNMLALQNSEHGTHINTMLAHGSGTILAINGLLTGAVDSMGFPRDAVRSKLPASISKDEKTVTELGHIWYADKTMGDFVHKAEKKHPDSLFVITGDHSERFTFAVEQDIRAVSTIPCIFYGQGVQKNWFDDKSIGCHMQLAGTLAELLGEPGFKYSAMLPDVFAKNEYVFNHRLLADGTDIFVQDKLTDKHINEQLAAVRNVGAWRVLKGNDI